LTQFSQWQPLILGIILVLVLLFMPSGLFGLQARVTKKISGEPANKAVQTERKKM